MKAISTTASTNKHELLPRDFQNFGGGGGFKRSEQVLQGNRGAGDIYLLLPSPRRKASFGDSFQFSPDRPAVEATV